MARASENTVGHRSAQMTSSSTFRIRQGTLPEPPSNRLDRVLTIGYTIGFPAWGSYTIPKQHRRATPATSHTRKMVSVGAPPAAPASNGSPLCASTLPMPTFDTPHPPQHAPHHPSSLRAHLPLPPSGKAAGSLPPSAAAARGGAGMHRPVAVRVGAARDATASPCMPLPVSAAMTPPNNFRSGGGSKLGKTGGVAAAGGGAAAASRLVSGVRAAATAVVTADFDPRRAAVTGLLMVAEAAARDRAPAAPQASQATVEAKRAAASGALALLSLAAEDAPRAPTTATTEHWRLSDPSAGAVALPATTANLLPTLAVAEPQQPHPTAADGATASKAVAEGLASPKRAPTAPPTAPMPPSTASSHATAAPRAHGPVAPKPTAAVGTEQAKADQQLNASGAAEADVPTRSSPPSSTTHTIEQPATASSADASPRSADASAPPKPCLPAKLQRPSAVSSGEKPATTTASPLLFVRLGGIRPPRISFGFDRIAHPARPCANGLLAQPGKPTGGSSSLRSEAQRPSPPSLDGRLLARPSMLRSVARADSISSSISSGVSSPTEDIFSPPASCGDDSGGATSESEGFSRSSSAASYATTDSAVTTSTTLSSASTIDAEPRGAMGGGLPAGRGAGPSVDAADGAERASAAYYAYASLSSSPRASPSSTEPSTDADEDDEEEEDDDDLRGIDVDASAAWQHAAAAAGGNGDGCGAGGASSDLSGGMDQSRPPSRARRASDRSPPRAVPGGLQPKRHRNIDGRATPSPEEEAAEAAAYAVEASEVDAPQSFGPLGSSPAPLSGGSLLGRISRAAGKAAGRGWRSPVA